MARRRRKHEEGVLMKKTRELLRATEQPFADIFKATDIPENWLWRFSDGRIPDPGVNRIECLYTHLTGRPLEL